LLADALLALVVLGLAAWALAGPVPQGGGTSLTVLPADAAPSGAIVRLDRDNRLYMDNTALDEAALVERLCPGGSAPQSATLAVSGDALYANVARSAALLARAGVREIYVSTAP
jgi:hypothetical protein